jgi:hypothetical protein
VHAADCAHQFRYDSGVTSTVELAELARTVPRDEFVVQVPNRFLVLGIVLGMGGDTQRPMTFATQALVPSEKPLGSSQLIVLPLVKSANNPYQDRVSVGRARNCDLVIRDSGVSKLHALIWMNGEVFTLVDVGSQNGTWLNGQRLTVNQAAPLERNDEISFGGVPAVFMDAAGVHTVLKTAGTTAL